MMMADLKFKPNGKLGADYCCLLFRTCGVSRYNIDSTFAVYLIQTSLQKALNQLHANKRNLTTAFLGLLIAPPRAKNVCTYAKAKE